MIVCVLGVNAELVVSAVAKSCTDDTSDVFLRLSIQRKHHLRMIRVRVSGSILILDHPHSSLERLLNESSLTCPGSMKVAHPDISDTNREIARIKTGQCNRLLLKILNFCPGLDHIHILICTIAHSDIKRINRILESDADDFCRRFISLCNRLNLQDGGHIAICVSKGYSCLSGTIKAICRICIVVWNTCRLKICKIYIREQATEILNPQLRTWVGLQYQFDIRCCNAELCDCRNGYRH